MSDAEKGLQDMEHMEEWNEKYVENGGRTMDEEHTIIRSCVADVTNIMENPKRTNGGCSMAIGEEIGQHVFRDEKYRCTCGIRLDDLEAAVTHSEKFGQ